MIKNCVRMSGFREVLFTLEEFNRLDESEKAPYIESFFGEIVDDDGVSDVEEDEMILEELVDVSDSEEPIGGQEETDIICDDDDDHEDDEEEEPPTSEVQLLTAAEGTEWTDVSNTTTQTLRRNIVRQRNEQHRRTVMYNIQQNI